MLAFLAAAGRLGIFTVTAVSHCVRPPFFPRHVVAQMVNIGYYSLPVVGLTAVFTGAVLALQIYEGSSRFNAESAVAGIVVIGFVRELGPVLAGLMVAGRVSAAMAAEIGTMRVTEQIDALTTLATDPSKYLVAPRLIAATCMLPCLVLVALMGCYHGYHSRGGAQGVGVATTNAVVSASILILTANYIVTEMFFSR